MLSNLLLTLGLILGIATIMVGIVWGIATCLKIARTGWSHFEEKGNEK